MDSSIYDALVRLSQPWVMRYPLIDFHGNQGAITGDGPAAMRYTEARLSALAEEGMLKKVKDTVAFIPNYDETTTEPVTLPALFPNLLCNPTTGIGVAMASGWAPHNLREVAEAIEAQIDGQDPYPFILGPDFPTGGVIINKDEIPTILKTGRGSVKIRARYKIEKNSLVFYEIPYGTSLEGLIDEIDETIERGDIVGISDVHDETNKDGIRIVITPIVGIQPEALVEAIYAKTRLQSSFSYNQKALIDNQPMLLSFAGAIQSYIDFNQSVILKEAQVDKTKAETRLNIIVGLLKALDIIDEIIAFIKASQSPTEAKQGLINKFEFNEAQAQAILDMKLAKLAKLEGDKLREEQGELEKLLIWLNSLIEQKSLRLTELKKRLKNFVEKYGDERKTDLIQLNINPNKKIKEIINPEEVIVVFNKNGFIKRVSKDSFKTQHRNTIGTTNNNNIIVSTLNTSTIDDLLCFSNKGKVYRIVVDKIPAGDNRNKGVYLGALLNLSNDEYIQNIVNRSIDEKYVVFITEKGFGKKVLLTEFNNIKTSGCKAINLTKEDKIVSVFFATDEDILIVGKNNKAIRIKSDDIKILSKTARGNKVIDTNGTGVLIAFPIQTSLIAIANKDGKGKVLKLEDFTPQLPGGKGITIGKDVIAVCPIEKKDKVLIIGQNNTVCLNVKDIPELDTKTAIGSKLIKDTEIVGMVKI